MPPSPLRVELTYAPFALRTPPSARQDRLQEALRASELQHAHDRITALESHEQRQERLQRMGLPEPPSDAAGGVTNLRLTLSSGARITRRFGADEPIRHVVAFLLVEEEVKDGAEWTLSTAYPMKVLASSEDTLNGDLGLGPGGGEGGEGAAGGSATLAELGLVGNAALNFRVDDM